MQHCQLVAEVAHRMRAVRRAHVDRQHVAVDKLIERKLSFPHFRCVGRLGFFDGRQIAFPTEEVGDRAAFDLIDVPDRAAIKA